MHELRREINLPGLGAEKVEVLVVPPVVPEPPVKGAAVLELDLNYEISDFRLNRFTVANYDKGQDLINGTIEGVNTSVGQPFLAWWEGERTTDELGGTTKIVPKYPALFMDDKPVLTFSSEVDNIVMVFGVMSWIKLEDDAEGELFAPPLNVVKQMILEWQTP